MTILQKPLRPRTPLSAKSFNRLLSTNLNPGTSSQSESQKDFFVLDSAASFSSPKVSKTGSSWETLANELPSPAPEFIGKDHPHYFEAGVPRAPHGLTDEQKRQHDQIASVVRRRLDSLNEQARGFQVDMKLIPTLEKLELVPVDFFTARACWQGTNKKKRRAVLESVLDQFPNLPKEKKNWRSATEAARKSGTEIWKSDDVFLKYFIENRQALKSLFRATLPSPWRASHHVTVFRGQERPSESNGYTADSTKPLGCYTRDPEVASLSRRTMVRKYEVSFNEVWSTSEATQNTFNSELEVTVYSPGGKRKGEPFNSAQARADFLEKTYGENIPEYLAP